MIPHYDGLRSGSAKEVPGSFLRLFTRTKNPPEYENYEIPILL